MFTFLGSNWEAVFFLAADLSPHLGTWHPIRPEDVQANESGYNQVSLYLDLAVKKNC